MVWSLHFNIDNFVLILEIHVHDDALSVRVNLDGMVAGEKLDSAHFDLENYFQQCTAEFFVSHNSGEDEVVSDVQVFPFFEFCSGLIFHSLSSK